DDRPADAGFTAAVRESGPVETGWLVRGDLDLDRARTWHDAEHFFARGPDRPRMARLEPPPPRASSAPAARACGYSLAGARTHGFGRTSARSGGFQLAKGHHGAHRMGNDPGASPAGSGAGARGSAVQSIPARRCPASAAERLVRTFTQ